LAAMILYAPFHLRPPYHTRSLMRYNVRFERQLTREIEE
jgi:hypothetical protein